jgi:hypothetical protein
MTDFAAVETRLRAILDPYRDRLEQNDLYGVDTLRKRGGGAHDFFAGVRVGKRYVSFHLMPVYTNPELLGRISPELRRRMQGKSCFNFARVDESLMGELERLTAAGYDATGGDARWKAAAG